MKAIISRIVFFFLAIYVSMNLLAQDGKKIDVDIDVNKHNNWYEQPWVWVLGAAVFIIVIVAVARGNRKA